MKDTLEIINRMQADGVIGKYAIGGAVGATFYLEPAATVDVDVFVIFPHVSGGSLLSLSPLYDYLNSRGYIAEREYILIGSWPVQFLPAGNELEEEAVGEAIPADVEGTPTWVMTAEHLVAIALRTGRLKDHARILQFLGRNVVNYGKLESILARHELVSRWHGFRKRYLNE